ncbi:unnamed protein product [Urochloa humidicola]
MTSRPHPPRVYDHGCQHEAADPVLVLTRSTDGRWLLLAPSLVVVTRGRGDTARAAAGPHHGCRSSRHV